MSINLKKNQTIDLRKNSDNTENNLSEIIIGMGWDPKKGQGEYDLDACALLLTNGKLISENDIIYYGNQTHSTKTVMSSGDNLTGDGDGDDERITVKLNSIPERYDKIVFYATIYQGRSRGQEFSKIENAYIRALNKNEKEIAKFDISGAESGMRTIIFAEAVRTSTGWDFKALGDLHPSDSVRDIADMYKGTSPINLSKDSQEPRKKLFGLF